MTMDRYNSGPRSTETCTVVHELVRAEYKYKPICHNFLKYQQETTEMFNSRPRPTGTCALIDELVKAEYKGKSVCHCLLKICKRRRRFRKFLFVSFEPLTDNCRHIVVLEAGRCHNKICI